MKTLILLFSIVLLTFTSCSSDDDATTQDPFIGTWKFQQILKDGVDITGQLTCVFEKTLVIESNGFITTNGYGGNIDGGCYLTNWTTKIWANMGDGMYNTNSGNSIETLTKVLFEDNKMYLDEIEDDILYREVYIKQ